MLTSDQTPDLNLAAQHDIKCCKVKNLSRDHNFCWQMSRKLSLIMYIRQTSSPQLAARIAYSLSFARSGPTGTKNCFLECCPVVRSANGNLERQSSCSCSYAFMSSKAATWYLHRLHMRTNPTQNKDTENNPYHNCFPQMPSEELKDSKNIHRWILKWVNPLLKKSWIWNYISAEEFLKLYYVGWRELPNDPTNAVIKPIHPLQHLHKGLQWLGDSLYDASCIAHVTILHYLFLIHLLLSWWC